MSPTIVVIGGSHAGIATVKAIFAQPQAANVILVNPLEDGYWNFASPRLIVKPELIPQSVAPLADLGKKKRHHDFKLVVGKATNVDFATKTVDVTGNNPLKYDYLVITLGSRNAVPAFKASEQNLQSTTDSLQNLHDQIKRAKSVCIIGGGPTGVELAGEIGVAFPKVSTTLITGQKAPLAQLNNEKTSRNATTQLEKLGVEVINTRAEIQDNSVTYKGTTTNFDLVIPTFSYTPNTEFLPDAVKDSQGYVIVDDYFRVKGAENVLAWGDVALITTKTAADINLGQTKLFTASLKETAFQLGTATKKYSQGKPLLFVPIGPNGGVGVLFGWNAPSFLVWAAKLRDFMLGQAKLKLT